MSVSSVRGALPVGATVSVVQLCPGGSNLDKRATRSGVRDLDADLDRHLRLASRELWRTGTVSRYRVMRRVAAGGTVSVVNGALCTSTVASAVRTVRGRAATDLRVWGPAPARLRLQNVTLALVSDDLDADYSFATVMRAAGVGRSRGSLRGAVAAAQAASRGSDFSTVTATGTTRRGVPKGRFVSMVNTYTYTTDLTRKVDAG